MRALKLDVRVLGAEVDTAMPLARRLIDNAAAISLVETARAIRLLYERT